LGSAIVLGGAWTGASFAAWRLWSVRARSTTAIRSQIIQDRCREIPLRPAQCNPTGRVDPGDCPALRRLGRVDQGAVALRGMLLADEFDAVEGLMRDLLAHRTRTHDGYHYAFLVSRKSLEPALQRPELLPKLDAWVAERSASPMARAFRGRYHALAAWQLRGGDWAYRVPESAWKKVHDHLERARADFEEARRIEPGHTLATVALLHYAPLFDTDCTEAEALFQQAMAIDPDLHAAYDSKMTLLMPKWGRTADFAPMFELARGAAACAPAGSLLPLLLVDARSEQGSQEARDAGSDDEGDQPATNAGTPSASERRAASRRSYLARPEVWADIATNLERLMADYPASAAWPSRLARETARVGKLDEAMRLHKLALERDPANGAAHAEFGAFLLFQMKDEDGALAEYEKALALDPFDARSWKRKAWIHFKRGRFDEAQGAYLRASEVDPYDRRASVQLALVAVRLQDYPVAVERYAKAIQIDPEDAKIRYGRAFAEIKLGQFEAAVADTTKAIELDPSYKAAYGARAYALAKLGRHAEAQRDRERAQRLSP
jgi:tetratricopeptide (TPR) repeat protein